VSNKQYLRRQARRACKSGYPKSFVFKTPEELAAYFSTEKIICLRCGRGFKALVSHLIIHEMTTEDYKRMYGIPWTYGLSCESTKELHRELALRQVDAGVFFSSAEKLSNARSALAHQRPRQPIRETLVFRNLASMNAGKSGEYSKRRIRGAKRGSLKFKEKMRARPQTIAATEMLKNWWRGKHQSPEHIAKLKASRLASRLAKKTVQHD
jgi:hypothetical protein